MLNLWDTLVKPALCKYIISPPPFQMNILVVNSKKLNKDRCDIENVYCELYKEL